ncbi:MAG TPA: methionine--tRNA ligase subunit beta, partial [Armatimonadota bacterium]
GGEKISKSKGALAEPRDVANTLTEASGCDFEVAIDALRYFLLREMPFGLDGSFSEEAVIGRFNNDLANDLGNLLNRSHSLTSRLFEGKVPDGRGYESPIRQSTAATLEEYAAQLGDFQFMQSLQTIWRLLSEANKWFNDSAPWKAAPEEAAGILYSTLEVVRVVSVALSPFMPVACAKLLEQLGGGALRGGEAALWSRDTAWGGLEPGTALGEATPLFPRIDAKTAKAVLSRGREESKREKAPMSEQSTPETPAAAQPSGAAPETGLISIDDFKKVQLRTATVLSAEPVPGANKLLKLTVDLGDEDRSLVAGIAETYAPGDLVGKTVVIVANLQPATIRGVVSQGMILAADLGGKAVFLTPEREVPPGAKVR